jgi:hypothetical protein
MKNFIVYAKYNPETGLSKVWIKNKYGVFMGKSRLHPEDKEFASEYIGCHFAEMKATINAYKKKKQDLQLRLKELVYFNEILMTTRGADMQSTEARKLRKRIYILKKEIEQVEKKIEKLKDDFQYEVKARDESMRLLRKIKENRKNPNLPEERQKLKKALEEKYKNEND